MNRSVFEIKGDVVADIKFAGFDCCIYPSSPSSWGAFISFEDGAVYATGEAHFFVPSSLGAVPEPTAKHLRLCFSFVDEPEAEAKFEKTLRIYEVPYSKRVSWD